MFCHNMFLRKHSFQNIANPLLLALSLAINGLWSSSLSAQSAGTGADLTANPNNLYVIDPRYAMGPQCRTLDDREETKGVQWLGGPPYKGKGIGAGRYVGIVGVGHGADGATYFRIHPQPYGASVGWV
jgi:hypothetical protein